MGASAQPYIAAQLYIIWAHNKLVNFSRIIASLQQQAEYNVNNLLPPSSSSPRTSSRICRKTMDIKFLCMCALIQPYSTCTHYYITIHAWLWWWPYWCEHHVVVELGPIINIYICAYRIYCVRARATMRRGGG